MFWPKGPSNYPQSIIIFYPFRTTFHLFAVPYVPPGSPVGGQCVVDGNKLAQLIPSLGPGSSCSQRCRRLEVSLSHLRIGHTRLTHGHLMARVCDHCYVRLFISHILVEFPTYSVPRNRFYPSLTSMPPRKRLPFSSPTYF